MRITLKLTVCVIVWLVALLAVGMGFPPSRLALVGAVYGGFVGVLCFLLVGRPIHRLIEMVRGYATGDLSARVVLPQHDEIGELAKVMNRMAEELARAQKRVDEEAQGHLEALAQLRHADRLATVGKLISGIAHELGAPLNTVASRAAMIASGEVHGEEACQNARIVVEQAHRMTGIVRHTLAYAHRGGPQRRPVDLEGLARQAFSLVRPLASRRRASLRIRMETRDPIAEVDPGKLLQVLTNLVTNGIQSMPDGGTLTVAIGRAHAVPPEGAGVPGDCVYIEVRDEGRGIPAEHLEKIFDAFFTTKQPEEGTGLGLPIAQGIVREHGGWIEVESEIGRGSTFKVRLPVEVDPCPDAS